MNRNIPVLALLIAVAFVGPRTSAAADDAGKTAPVFEVPTTGTIMDVVYRPEFDEWWIKCREGDAVVVYSYDPESKKWGKVRFVRKKSDPGKATAVPTRSKTGKEQSPKSAPQSERTEKKPDKKDPTRSPAPDQESVKAEQPAPKKEPVATKQEPKKTNWWDIRNVLKSGEKLINPFKGEDKKPQTKPADELPEG